MAIKKSVKILLWILLGIFSVSIIYVSYVFLSYYRLEDNIKLEPLNNNSAIIETDKEYSVLIWNLGFGAYSDDYSFFMDGGKYSRAFSKDDTINNIESMAESAYNEKTDFYMFQEVDVSSTRSYYVDETSLLKNKFDDFASVFAQNYDSPYLFYPFNSPHGKSKSGLMTFSSFKIESGVRRSLPIENSFSKLLDLDRCYSIIKIPVSDGKYLCLYNIHLSAYTTDPTTTNQQIDILITDMQYEYECGNYIICGGDFNKDLLGDSSEYFGVDGKDFSWAQPFPFAKIPNNFSLIDNAENNVPSCRNADRPYDENNFVLVVDGYIISENIIEIDSKILDFKFQYSDHNPVKLNFKLKA